MKKAFSSASLAAIFISGLILVSTVQFGSAQDGLVVTITSDTTWAKEDSPVVFSGPVVVSTGVTLTIDAGVTVNLNGYPLFVNGTLKAIGSASDKIQISGGDITFGNSSQTGSDSAFENAVINSTISCSKPLAVRNNIINASISIGDNSTLSDNIILATVTTGSLCTISGNNISGDVTIGDSCTIFDNTINGDTTVGTYATITNNIINGSKIVFAPFGGYSYTIALTVANFSTISNNSITGGLSATSCTISNNSISGGAPFTDWAGRPEDATSAVEVTGNSLVTSNVIWSSTGGYGVLIRTGYTHLSGNTIQNSVRVAGDALIEGNLISNSGTGIQVGEIFISAFNDIDYGHGNSIIRNNIITGNYIGVGSSYEGGSATIELNLISNNTYGVNVNSQVTIQNNTISNSSTAIQLQVSPLMIAYNNIINYTQNSLYLSSVPTDVNATYNWWGTTDTQAIGLTIHDSKYDFNLGAVNFIPLLTEQNPAAHPLGPPPIPEFTPIIYLALLITITLVMSVGFKIRTRILFKKKYLVNSRTGV
jgi:hypothetical protein